MASFLYCPIEVCRRLADDWRDDELSKVCFSWPFRCSWTEWFVSLSVRIEYNLKLCDLCDKCSKDNGKDNKTSANSQSNSLSHATYEDLVVLQKGNVPMSIGDLKPRRSVRHGDPGTKMNNIVPNCAPYMCLMCSICTFV